MSRETLAKIEARRGGIVLFHDIKASTARALPTILSELRARGYRVVHMTAKEGHEPEANLFHEYQATLAKAEVSRGGAKKNLVPFYGSIGPERTSPADTSTASGNTVSAGTAGAPVTNLAPSVAADHAAAPSHRAATPPHSKRASSSTSSRVYTASSDATTDGWSTSIKRPKTRAAKSTKLRERQP